jgi:hypothetical protein
MFKKILFAALIVAPSLCAAGSSTTANYYYYWDDTTLSANSYGYRERTCPSNYPRLISGSCGHRDYNSAQQDIKVNFAGGINGAETTTFRCLVANDNRTAGRAIRVGIVCGK